MSNKAWANRTIPRPTKGVRLVKEKYSLRDIARLCHQAFLEDAGQLREFASAFPPTREGLRELFDFVDENFTYVEDRGYNPKGKEITVQAVQSPAAMWHTTRQGDCKSFTVFIACCIHNMGLPVILRLVGYGSKYEKHIYPVAILRGEEIPLDVVFKKQQNGPFGSEKLPMEKIQDIVERPGLYKVGNTAAKVTEGDLRAALENIRKVSESIPDEVLTEQGGDITNMTVGQFDAWLLLQALEASGGAMEQLPADALANIRRHIATQNASAFKPLKVAVPVPANEVAGFKDIFENIGDAIRNAIKKIANLFHKEDAGKVAPFFLYLYLTPAQLAKAKPEVKRRHAQQKKVLAQMVKKGDIGTEAQVMASMATNFKKKYKATPQEVLEAAMQPKAKKVGLVGAAALTAASVIVKNKEEIGAAIKGVFNFFKKIFEIFKKKDKDDEAAEAAANEANASDLLLLEATDTTTTDPNGGGGNGGGSDGGGGSDNTLLYLGGAVLAALLLFKK